MTPFYEIYLKDATEKFGDDHSFSPPLMRQYILLSTIHNLLTDNTGQNITKETLICLFTQYKRVIQLINDQNIRTVRSYINAICTFLTTYECDLGDYKNHPEYDYYNKKIYAQSVIYQIKHNTNDVVPVYIGSTTNFCTRCTSHKSQSRNPTGIYYLYYLIHQHGGFDNFDIVELEKYACNNRTELIEREKHWIDTTPNCINKNKTPEFVSESINFYLGIPETSKDRTFTDVALKPNDNIKHEMSTIKCPCGKTYLATSDSFNQHTKYDPDHILWLYTLTVHCQCGDTYNYSNACNHYKSAFHKKWQDQDPENYGNVIYVCRCGDKILFRNKLTHERDNHFK